MSFADRDALAPLLARLTRAYRVPGAQLALRQDDLTTVVTHGELVAGTGTAVADDAVFPLGSLTKPFTATVAMMLAEAGDAELDSPLAGYLPELSGTVADCLTLRQLLSHRGGLASAIDETAVQPVARHRWVMKHCQEADLVHPPGPVFSYSNIGYILVGLVAELVTGLRWQEAIDDILLAPMGVAPAFVTRAGPPARPMAAGHAISEGTHRVQVLHRQSLRELEAPNGDLALSAADLVTFATSRPAGGDLIKEMLTDQLGDATVGSFGMADSWGLGWAVYHGEGRTWYGHDGNADGTSCHLRFEPQTDTAVALTTNASTGMAMWHELVAWLRQAGLDLGNYSFSTLPGSPEPEPARAEFAGRYRNGCSEFVVAMGDDGRLELSADGLLHAFLTCYPGLRFTMENAGPSGMRYVGRFIRDPAGGEINLVQIGGRTARREYAGNARPCSLSMRRSGS